MSESSTLQSIMTALQFNNYVSLVIATAVVYDYIITFGREIDYIWNRSWTFVSYMFVLVRYLGLAVAFIQGLYGSTFIPGPTLACPSNIWYARVDPDSRTKGTALLFALNWAFLGFLAAADIVMILRLYAMYGKSRIIVAVLLVFCAVTIIFIGVVTAFYSSPANVSISSFQVLNVSFCTQTVTTTSKIGRYKLIPRLSFAGLMLLLVVVRLCMESFQAYKVTKQWKVSQYVSLLSREGVLYFVVHLLNNVNFGDGTLGTVMTMLIFILMFILSPRFIMNVRELHLRKLDGWDVEIDAGFGSTRNMESVASPDGVVDVWHV